MKLGVILSGKRPEDVAQRLAQAREAGFSLCQLNLAQGGYTRADLVAIADSMLEHGIRPVAVGCYVNPMRPDEPSFAGANRADLDLLLHSLDIVGARRVVIWSGTHAGSMYEAHAENGSEESLETLHTFIRTIVAETKARHYSLVIEPWQYHVLSSEERIIAFHERLEPAVREHVRYVLDATNLITPERYETLDKEARAVCRRIGPAAALVHLKDCIMPPDGDHALPGPGQGRLDYPAYVEAVQRFAAVDAPAIVRNVRPAEFADVRDRMLQLSDRWQLA